MCCSAAAPARAQPDFVVCVTDATNLRQNLRLVLSLKRLGLPMVVALNMSDIARRKGIVIDAERLAGELGVPVVETVGVKTTGVRALIKVLDGVRMPAQARHRRGVANPERGGYRARSSGGAQNSRAWWAATGSTA